MSCHGSSLDKAMVDHVSCTISVWCNGIRSHYAGVVHHVQKRVFPPRATRTACRRSGILLYKGSTFSHGIEATALSIAAHRWCLLRKQVPINFLPIIGHKCSIMFRSGEFGGHRPWLNSRMFLSSSQRVVLAALCGGAPSC